MYWECASSFEEETNALLDNFLVGTEFPVEFSIPALIESLRQVMNTRKAMSGNAWFRMVQDYTSRKLTYTSDKLPAMSGVIAQLQDALVDTCYAGHWKSWFLRSLLWRVQESTDLYVFSDVKPMRLDFYRAPSWSFASIEGVILYDDVQYATFTECSELVEVSVTPKGINPLGEVKSGFARIKAPLTKLRKTKKVRGIPFGDQACLVELKNGSDVYAGVYFDVEPYKECVVLMITTSAGLAVEQLKGEENVYKRIGAVIVHARAPVESKDKDMGSVKREDIEGEEYPDMMLVTIL